MIVKSCYLARIIENEEVVKEYTEKLGCKIRHKYSPIPGNCVFTIEDAIGNKSVLITIPECYRSQLKSTVGTRVVVDDIHEGVEFFKADGYEPVSGIIETESNFVCSMIKGDDFRIVFEHKHNHK